MVEKNRNNVDIKMVLEHKVKKLTYNYYYKVLVLYVYLPHSLTVHIDTYHITVTKCMISLNGRQQFRIIGARIKLSILWSYMNASAAI